jgi:hypothetical protein
MIAVKAFIREIKNTFAANKSFCCIKKQNKKALVSFTCASITQNKTSYKGVQSFLFC